MIFEHLHCSQCKLRFRVVSKGDACIALIKIKEWRERCAVAYQCGEPLRCPSLQAASDTQADPVFAGPNPPHAAPGATQPRPF